MGKKTAGKSAGIGVTVGNEVYLPPAEPMEMCWLCGVNPPSKLKLAQGVCRQCWKWSKRIRKGSQ